MDRLEWFRDNVTQFCVQVFTFVLLPGQALGPRDCLLFPPSSTASPEVTATYTRISGLV